MSSSQPSTKARLRRGRCARQGGQAPLGCGAVGRDARQPGLEAYRAWPNEGRGTLRLATGPLPAAGHAGRSCQRHRCSAAWDHQLQPVARCQHRAGQACVFLSVPTRLLRDEDHASAGARLAPASLLHPWKAAVTLPLSRSMEAVAKTSLGSGASICDGTTHAGSGRESRANGTRPSPELRIAIRLPPLRFLSFLDPFVQQPPCM